MRRRTILTGLTSFIGGASPARAIADPALEDLVLVNPNSAGRLPDARRAWSLLATAHDKFQSGAHEQVAITLPDLLGYALAGRGQQSSKADEALLLAAISELYTLATDVMVRLGVVGEHRGRFTERPGCVVDPLLRHLTRLQHVLIAIHDLPQLLRAEHEEARSRGPEATRLPTLPVRPDAVQSTNVQVSAR